MTRGLWVVLVIGLVLMGVAGCWNPFSPPGGDGGGKPRIDRTSPQNLLNFFASAYVDKDIDKYSEALDESFTFTFLEEDYDSAGVSSVEPYWGKTEDVERTGLMFASVKTYSVEFDFGQIVMPMYSCTGHIFVGDEEQDVEAVCTMRHPDIKVTMDRGGPELTTLWVSKSLLDITMIQDRNDPGLWTILKIVEIKAE